MRALDFLDRFADLERAPDRARARFLLNLSRMRRLCARMKHPERGVPLLVHIAGTKGKGSTAAMTAAMLRAAGLRTGLYLSPHLRDFGERISVDGKPIREAALDRILRPHFRWALRLPPAERPSWFEWVTAAALEHFRRRRCDAAVLEVGLGGRLDATNIVLPAACAITRIDYDHTELLGRTLARISREKAGILKPGVPCVVAPQPPEAMREIRRVARRVGASLLPSRPARVRLGMPGAHQRENAGVALGVLRALGIPADRRALASVLLPGRVQVLRRRPPLVVDGAHTPASVRALARTLRQEFPGRRWTFVFGAARDKDLRGMLRELRGLAREVLAVDAWDARARDAREVAAETRRLGIPARTLPLREALGAPGPVCIAGSLRLAGAIPRSSPRRGPPRRAPDRRTPRPARG